MKKMPVMIIDFIAAVIVVLFIFVIAKIARDNYDVRYLAKHQTTAIIIDKNIKPAGTTPMYRFIGGGVYTIPVTNQEEPTIFVNIVGKKVAGVTHKNLYQKKEIGDLVNIEYLQPKYWGSPIIISIN
jgi:hypothetical protein